MRASLLLCSALSALLATGACDEAKSPGPSDVDSAPSHAADAETAIEQDSGSASVESGVNASAPTQASSVAATDAGGRDAAGDQPDAMAEGGAPSARGYGEVTIRGISRQISDQGVMMQAVEARATFSEREPTNSCTRKMIGPCVVESCAVGTTTPVSSLEAGPVRVTSPAGMCDVTRLGNSPGSNACPLLWDPTGSVESLQVSAAGAHFPAFDVRVNAPQAIHVWEPSYDLPAQRRKLMFQWNVEPGAGTVELHIGQAAMCSSAPPSPNVRAVCSAPTDSGKLQVPDAIFTELSMLRCMGATIRQVIAERRDIDGYSMRVSAELEPMPDYVFERPDVSCRGTHEPCHSFSGHDYPGFCTDHGCKWSASGCTGTPHVCEDVRHADCMDASPPRHPGCSFSSL